MINEYVCFFKKEEQVKSIKFKIYQNELTECWSSTVEQSLLQGENTPIGFFSNFNTDRESINIQVLSLVDVLKTYDQRFNLEWPLDSNKVTRKKLNILHEQFHFIEEESLKNRIIKDDKFQKSLQLVNDRIHNFEETFLDYTKSIKWFLSSTENSVQITDSLRKFWNINFFKYYRPGTLFLGYHTVGKSLFQCYRSNDVELVKKNGIRQQELITSEVMFYADWFIDYDSKSSIRKWIKSNNLNVDMSNPKYKYGHQPALGFLSTDISKKEIDNLFVDWEFFKVDIN